MTVASSRPRPATASADPSEYFERVRQQGMGPLWKAMGDLMPTTPKPREVPYQWRWADIRDLVYESAKVVRVEDAVRRVLMLLNPGLPTEQAAVTQTLYAGIQIILPGEVAPAHRHTPNALRFVMEGEGAFTTVEGEKTILRKGDVVTTPNWTWHDHGNESKGPVVWLDALDIPLVNALSGMFYEDYPQKTHPVRDAENSSQRTYGRALRPTGETRASNYSPILNYTYANAREALESMPSTAWSPTEGRVIEYINPLTGGPILPTMDAFLQQVDPGMDLKACRQSASRIVMGVEGEGTLEVEDQRFRWKPFDVMVVPAWAKHRVVPTGRTPAVLFSYTNAPVMRALSLYRETVL